MFLYLKFCQNPGSKLCNMMQVFIYRPYHENVTMISCFMINDLN